MSPNSAPQTAQLRALHARLLPLAVQARVEREYWIVGADHEESDSYCEACACTRLAAYRMLDPEGGYGLGGGYTVYEHDSGECCEGCQVMLDYSLTNYGAEEELAYFTSEDRPATLTPEDAYALGILLDAYDGVPAPPALQTLLDWLETVVPGGEGTR